MNPRCKHGHPWLDATTRWVRHRNGNFYRACRKCQAMQANLRYRTDASFRESEKARNLANYHARQE